jgi:hypothetical protein
MFDACRAAGRYLDQIVQLRLAAGPDRGAVAPYGALSSQPAKTEVDRAMLRMVERPGGPTPNGVYNLLRMIELAPQQNRRVFPQALKRTDASKST